MLIVCQQGAEILMSSVLKWIGVTAALAFVAIVPAQAQTTGAYLLNDTTPITVQGWTITLGVCDVSGTTSCAGSEVIPTVSNTSYGITLSLVFESISGGPLQTNLGGASGSDVSFPSGITIQAPTGEQIYQTTVNVSGTDSTQPTHVSVNDNVVGVVGSGNGPGVSLATNLGISSTLQSGVFTPYNSVVARTDFRAGSAIFTGAATMNSATLTFTAAPEPISSSLLAVGLGGLGFVRRKTRRTC
jgi:hypothetical protein